MPIGDGAYLLVVRASGKCIAVGGSSMNNGDPVQQQTCRADDPAQRFRLDPATT
jgi:hypothetical protein